jgi:NADH dehydrogenase FAD-containing subunit
MKTSPKFNQDTAEKQLENVGIKKIMNTAVLEVSKNGLRLKPNNDENSEAYEQSADLVLCALGTSQSPLLSKISPVLDLDAKSGRLLVDRSFQSVNTEKVFALGDCSVIEGVSLPSTAQVAMQQADITARNILVKLGLREGSGANAAYLEKFTYVPLGEMLTLGRVDAAISSLGGLLEIEGPLASLSRRLVYALRMPTRQQTATALVSSAVTGAITIANTISSIRTNKDSAKSRKK